MKIGELAELTGCGVETIRYYEKQGLLAEPERSGGNYRTYGQEELERLRFIRNCRSLDMTQAEIKRLLAYLGAPQDDCAGVNAIIDEHIAHVQHRIKELEGLARQLGKIRRLCVTPAQAGNCPILSGLSESPAQDSPDGDSEPSASSGHGRKIC